MVATTRAHRVADRCDTHGAPATDGAISKGGPRVTIAAAISKGGRATVAAAISKGGPRVNIAAAISKGGRAVAISRGR